MFIMFTRKNLEATFGSIEFCFQIGRLEKEAKREFFSVEHFCLRQMLVFFKNYFNDDGHGKSFSLVLSAYLGVIKESL